MKNLKIKEGEIKIEANKKYQLFKRRIYKYIFRVINKLHNS